MMNERQNTDIKRLDFLFKVETVEFSKDLDGKYCCLLYGQEVDIHGFGDSHRVVLDEVMAKWEDISCLSKCWFIWVSVDCWGWQPHCSVRRVSSFG